MADKPYTDMTDDELRAELLVWERHVETASGWSSAYFAACQVKAICNTGNRRGLGLVNNHPIRTG